MNEDGTELIGDDPGLSDDHRVEMMRDMITARRMSEKMVTLQRQGRGPVFSQLDGQEATVVGALKALDWTQDWILRAYREEVALWNFPPERMPPRNVGLATQIPHAVGVAWGLQLRQETACVLAFFGDGSSSEGDFYEGANHAGVLGVPLVLFCVNNGWAISTPRSIQTRSETIAIKAQAFGFPGIQVDGNDVLAVYAATKQAVDRARGGDGPALIEAVTYRLGGHTTADDPTRYVKDEEKAAWQARDPIPRFRRHLEKRGLWDPAIETEASSIGEQAAIDRVARFAGLDAAAPETLFDNVYADLTPRLITERDELRQHVGIARGA